MRKTIIIATLAAAATGSVFAAVTTNVVIGWETWKWQGNPPSQFESVPTTTDGATGLATQDGLWKINPSAGSSDGTFGTIDGASTNITESGSGWRLQAVTDGSIIFSAESTGADLDLLAFHFDALSKTNIAPNAWTLEVLAGGSITAGVVTNGILPAGGTRDLADFDVDLTGLADHSLSSNTLFELSFSGGNTFSNSFMDIDNAALTAVVPVPPKLDLLVGWEEWTSGDDPSTSDNGATGTTTNGNGWTINFRGSSDDGSFGSLSTNVAIADLTVGTNSATHKYGGRVNNVAAGTDVSIDFVVTETAGTGADLGYFHMDIVSRGAGGPDTWTLEVLPGSSISEGVVASGAIEASTTAYYLGDVDVYLADLADSRLDAGGTVKFRLTCGGGTVTKHLDYDNFAVSKIVPDVAFLLGWETWSSTAPKAATQATNDVSGAASTVGWSINDAGSVDGTWGGAVTDPVADITTDAANDSARLVNGAEGYWDFSVTNTSTNPRLLGGFHFDTGTFRPGSSHNWELEVLSGDITIGTVASGDAPNVVGGVTDWYDVDVYLTNLADHELDAGGVVTFRLNFTGGAGTSGHHQYLDNVAVSFMEANTPVVDLSCGITAYSFDPSATSSLSFTGGVSSAYVLKSTLNLTVPGFETTVTPSSASPGSVDGNVITTDASGAATVLFTETDDNQFYKIESAP